MTTTCMAEMETTPTVSGSETGMIISKTMQEQILLN